MSLTDFTASGAERIGRETKPTTPAPNNFPVPVLAKPIAAFNKAKQGEARESTQKDRPPNKADSRGGESNLSGGVESRHAGAVAGPSMNDRVLADGKYPISQPRPDAESGSGSSAPPAQSFTERPG